MPPEDRRPPRARRRAGCPTPPPPPPPPPVAPPPSLSPPGPPEAYHDSGGRPVPGGVNERRGCLPDTPFGSCGGWTRTNDLKVMSLASYLCSTPRGQSTESRGGGTGNVRARA